MDPTGLFWDVIMPPQFFDFPMKLFLQTDRSEVVAALASSWILSRRGIKTDPCDEWDGTIDVFIHFSLFMWS